jgi:pimeloyl-ACP methyl ester carboxylesterase
VPSIRTLPDRPVSVNPQFGPFPPGCLLSYDPAAPVPLGVAGACEGSCLGTVLEPAAPAPPERARGPGGRTGGNTVHRPVGHGLPAAGVGHRLGGRAPAALVSCGEGFEAFQCATAVVPLDYDRPKGKQITLALARLPAANPSRRIGSLFLNPGGPGGSGVDFVLEAGPFLYSDEVRARFDLVGFDPRGIMRSSPLRCYETFDEAIADLWPISFPVTRAEERLWVRSDRAIARACAERGGPILDHMSTANVARDMDLLRRAVGDRKLTYAGYSYGSYLGATYANLFPGKVRALVVDGVLDRSPGPPAAATRPAPCRSRTGCAAPRAPM